MNHHASNLKGAWSSLTCIPTLSCSQGYVHDGGKLVAVQLGRLAVVLDVRLQLLQLLVHLGQVLGDHLLWHWNREAMDPCLLESGKTNFKNFIVSSFSLSQMKRSERCMAAKGPNTEYHGEHVIRVIQVSAIKNNSNFKKNYKPLTRRLSTPLLVLSQTSR